MNINFKSEVFSKLYQMAEKQDTSIPVLINKLIEKVLSEEEKMNKTEQSLTVKIVNAICGSGKSYKLKQYIKTNPDKKALIAVPTPRFSFSNTIRPPETRHPCIS